MQAESARREIPLVVSSALEFGISHLFLLKCSYGCSNQSVALSNQMAYNYDMIFVDLIRGNYVPSNIFSY